ncbi:uncharacterized protein LOC131010692 isoform X1 [Salvia miltiorrhiza]|uniref:uncharacterized protein LOC131002439 isoform X1 n=2 Tax=Salvia miltiorrhiza TaxID=226208 RepID=UPI0025ABB049|nr:uncharacterized protein LOC131002439 isoform X1 [Salvia miltiorrhiza]XP_057794336.1 uncharacterized protein LOC131010692 isoform X1 [Salvia miltiorrhiza]
MLGDKSLILPRYELLSIIRKHSKSIGQTILDEEESQDDLEMDPSFWHNVIDSYFVRSRESRGREDDDLIFFVRKMNLESQRSNGDAESNSPYFVRRWAPELDELVGGNSLIIDWRRSFYLNLIAHTSFSVTVAICSHQVIRQYQQGETLSPIYKVVKTVYASPSRINFHLDSRKEVETTPAYPDICFAVDDFDSTFDSVVLTDPDHCYCVLLNAHDGAAFPHERKTEQANSDVSSSENVTSHGKTKNSKITLFSGFVSYQMVREAYDAGRSGFGSLLSLGHSSGRTDRIFMKGPGGRGEVEVAVSGILDQSKVDLGPQSPIQISKKGLGLGTIVRKAASVASTAAKQAYAAASSSPNLDGEMLPLKCCLMSISLPWENIVHDLLFKGSPAVNL